jgi:hypothetical protein
MAEQHAAPGNPAAVRHEQAPKLTIFISYVHDDGTLSDALSNAIQDAFGPDIAVFLDKVSIQQGENIQASIRAHLEKADVLVVVSTGALQPSHWAGYEIGYFQRSHAEPAPPDRPLWGRMVILCSAGNVPGPIGSHQKYLPLDIGRAELEMSQEDFEATVRVADDNPLLIWFGELFLATAGRQLDQARGNRETFKAILGRFVTKVFAEFKRRPKFVLRPQKQVLMRLHSRTPLQPPHLLANDAEITFLGGAHTIFGIRGQATPQTFRWVDFCVAIRGQPMSSFWISTLVRLVTGAVEKEGMEVSTGNLVSSADQLRLYRVILTTCTTYYNDMVEASIYMVEVYRRRDYGDPATTLLAKGLQMAMRFRSLFLEQTSKFHYLNILLERDRLAEVATQIVTELDLLQIDAIEADLHQPASWNGLLDPVQIETMARVWQPLQDLLRTNCAAAAAAADQASVEVARRDLGDTLKRIPAEVGPLNDTLLEAVAAQLIKLADGSRSQRAKAVAIAALPGPGSRDALPTPTAPP